jgi:hypothetical protein
VCIHCCGKCPGDRARRERLSNIGLGKPSYQQVRNHEPAEQKIMLLNPDDCANRNLGG